jgi:methylenetetrahydrofolate reductase (NADPH)
MKSDSMLASKIEGGDFIVTAEYRPPAGTEMAAIEALSGALDNGLVAVNVADNPYGVTMSSIAASVALCRSGIEPVCQLTTRDRNRIALQSDLMGAAYLGIKNVLCLSGYHQTLTGCAGAANIYDIDSVQMIATVRQMNEAGLLWNGARIEGAFSMLIGAAANPNLEPLELNIIRLAKKVTAGADFIQTQALFDVETFRHWLNAIRSEGITEKTAILAGVLPLASAAEANRLRNTYTDLIITEEVLDRMTAAGDEAAQRREGLAICAEIINQIKGLPGLRGVHLLTGGNEAIVPELIAAAAL